MRSGKGLKPGHRRVPSGGRPNEVNISAFEILKPISRGAYGRVVLAAKRTTRDLYAIKVIRKKDLQRKNQIEHIKTEREVMAHAEHPFVVRLYYSFTSADNLYMVMEFVNGGDLFSLLRNVGYLAEEVARLYVAEISLALEYLHCTLGVVHRDLKPDNVLIDQQGHIKLTDFGLSVFGLAPGDDAYDGDEPQAKVGTPDYMSPEVLLGETHGPPVDLWALGCLSFELLTGYTPFTGESVEEVFENILEHTRGDAVRWPEEEEHLSEQAFNLVTRLLEPVQEHRLGAAGGFDELRAAPFFDEVDWKGLRARETVVPFVPDLAGDQDVSYFTSKKPMSLNSCGGMTPVTPTTPGGSRASIPDGAPRISRCASSEEEEDPDFLNFSYNNLATLMQRNLELADDAQNTPRGSPAAPPRAAAPAPPAAAPAAAAPSGP